MDRSKLLLSVQRALLGCISADVVRIDVTLG